MYQEKTTQQRILAHCRKYPAMQSADLLKFLHQSSFGCGHLLLSPEAAAEYLRQEMQQCQSRENTVEELDGGFCRVHLNYAKDLGLSEETFARAFALSAAQPCDGAEVLEERLSIAEKMADEGVLPFPVEEFSDAAAQWRKAGYPACHHSDAFGTAYAPAYRVLTKTHAHWLPLLARIDQIMKTKNRVLIAIEGGSASGKTTLADFLQQIYDCCVFHMDDFFLRPEQRTAERFALPGGNIDHERFLDEVLQPLSRGDTVHYRRFDCENMILQPAEERIPKGLNIIEGAYSMHPTLAAYYDFSVFLRVTPELQRRRIERRNTPQMAQRFFDIWIPLEHAYFTATDAAARCSLIWEVEQ